MSSNDAERKTDHTMHMHSATGAVLPQYLHSYTLKQEVPFRCSINIIPTIKPAPVPASVLSPDPALAPALTWHATDALV